MWIFNSLDIQLLTENDFLCPVIALGIEKSMLNIFPLGTYEIGKKITAVWKLGASNLKDAPIGAKRCHAMNLN